MVYLDNIRLNSNTFDISDPSKQEKSTPFTVNGKSTVNDILKLLAESAGFDIDVPYKSVTWFANEPVYGIGDNTINRYQCWCPHNLQYDSTRNRFIFVQCHRASHTGSYKAATMHVIYPNDILKRDDITIPQILGIANLVITDDGDYILYPKTAEAVRYVSTDGGTTWTTENLNSSLIHAFGIYLCNGVYYAGCDYQWSEYHYSEDGLNWTTKYFTYEDADGNPAKEHSFCYWNGHVYAFGRRDFNNGENPNNCAVVLRLDGNEWTVIDESHLLAYQSNCCPVAFGDCIAIAHINRVNHPVLYYTLYDGESFETVQTFENLTKDGWQREFTTPSLAFGNGYSCIAFSFSPVIVPLGSAGCANGIRIGTYENKNTKSYFEYKVAENPINPAQIFYEDIDEFEFLPSAEGVSYRWSTSNFDSIINNSDHDIYFYFKSKKTAYVPSSDSVSLVYDGKTVLQKNIEASTYQVINWLLPYDGKYYAVGALSGDYTASYASVPVYQNVVECTLVETETQPTTDLTGVPNGTIIRKLAANGGTCGKIRNAKYIEYID